MEQSQGPSTPLVKDGFMIFSDKSSCTSWFCILPEAARCPPYLMLRHQPGGLWSPCSRSFSSRIPPALAWTFTPTPGTAAGFFSLLVCQPSLSLCPRQPWAFPSPFSLSSPRAEPALEANVHTHNLLFSWNLLFSAASLISSSYCSLWCTVSFQSRASALCTGPSTTWLKTWSPTIFIYCH